MLTIDASQGEGGGQIVRTALALSLATGTPFVLDKIRAGKKTPGLLRQHVVAVQAAVAVSAGESEGAQPGSLRLTFRPRRRGGGTHKFDATASGSAVLVAQTLVPALLGASEPAEIVVHGGTHIPASPCYEFFEGSYLGLLRKMGADVRCELWRHGFAPDGGGALRVWVSPRPLRRLDVATRGRVLARRAVAKVARLSSGIAEREIAVLTNRLGWGKVGLTVEEVEAVGSGNIVVATLKFAEVTLVMAELGNREVAAEYTARNLADRMDRFLPTDVPVDEHLADQLILPMALAGGGSFRTVEPSAHTRTQIGVLAAFLPELPVAVEPDGRGAWLVKIG